MSFKENQNIFCIASKILKKFFVLNRFLCHSVKLHPKYTNNITNFISRKYSDIAICSVHNP